MKLFEVPITDMMVVCGKNENENTRLGRVVMVQFVTPSFHPNLIGNVLSMSKCLHSYTEGRHFRPIFSFFSMISYCILGLL